LAIGDLAPQKVGYMGGIESSSHQAA
jgi:hypothetical protein